MSIPKNISEKHITRAVEEINVLGIPKSRLSRNYLLDLKGKHLPPKYVVSKANEIANNAELDFEKFNAKEAVSFLRKLGFAVEKYANEENLKQRFLEYLGQFHKNNSTSKEYVKMLPKIETWFKQNGIVSANYKFWKNIEQTPIIEDKLKSDYREKWKLLNKEEKNWYGSPWNKWVGFYNEMLQEDNILVRSEVTNFNKREFSKSLANSGLMYDELTITRFTASLFTKPFVILTGLSGSGKTKLAQAFAQWICQDDTQYRIVPVGADWTNREPLLGYPNALESEEYVKPDSDVLDLIIRANENRELPYFLILDEMNLSHVERYFADFLSVMESKESIPLYTDGSIKNGAPPNLNLPSNLFIIGTVNIDETTNMFSPKVLDRANTIEFRVVAEEMRNFLNSKTTVNLEVLNTKGAGMAKSFLKLAENKEFEGTDSEIIKDTLMRFFGQLKKSGAEFGYRSATEIIRLINQLAVVDDELKINEKLDIAIMQKLLPKLHGSRRKLCPVLETLGSFCLESDINIVKDVFGKDDFDFNGPNVRYSLALEKITRMHKGAIDNGFTSFAEA
ncbi:AAA family ATPase [Pricia sp. S334]|uniref:AAA family ATPase n=1 Tax=Pricia mediterranea TaxID=3076079 RepID=A0ABU3L447_9FLAO|nr:AAA family ATPase [Pricia sp. S334]MDT7828520.1 AAA family ATPase [Pricia sp. S334]